MHDGDLKLNYSHKILTNTMVIFYILYLTIGYLPSEDPVGAFLGNLTACEDNNFVRREIMKLNEASTISGWDIWISSGVISSILLSAGIATFGVYLVKLADPFMSCGGKYEGPPKNFNFQDSELSTLMEEKKMVSRRLPWAVWPFGGFSLIS